MDPIFLPIVPSSQISLNHLPSLRFRHVQPIRINDMAKIPTNISPNSAHKKERNSLKNMKCPINDLPNEILASIFSIGVNKEDDGDEGEDAEWEDMDAGEGFDPDVTG